MFLAEEYGLNKEISYKIGILHDIGKTHPEFEKRLGNKNINDFEIPFRHEICALFFLSLFSDEEKNQIIEGIIAHHKSPIDVSKRGFVDLYDRFIDDSNLDFHLGLWEEWSLVALDILKKLGIKTRPISREEAIESYHYAYNYVSSIDNGVSEYKGLLMAADHLVSALNDEVHEFLNKKKKNIDLSCYNRESDLYPLSKISTNSENKHTLLIAPTGTGKTDFLVKRTDGRTGIHYILPFQASINAMYKRFKDTLEKDNPEIDIRLKHASSKIVVEGKNIRESILQDKVMADIKVMTPHQLGGLAFGLKGYESLMLDIRGKDVIFDEIHAFNGLIMRFVLTIIKVLVSLDCKVHIGTATMPSAFKKKLIEILKGEVYEVVLPKEKLITFKRHIIHKINTNEVNGILQKHVEHGDKILCVFNTVKKAQHFFTWVKIKYSMIDKMLIHSRFERGGRTELEELLYVYNKSIKPCIVVATQVIEVSLDLNFDSCITEAAPIDAIGQRSGRVKRDPRNKSLGHVYITEPPNKDWEALPYNLDIVKKSFDILKDNNVFDESKLQDMIDYVYPTVDESDLDQASIFQNGEFSLRKLHHRQKSVLMEKLEIESANIIRASRINEYKESNFNTRIKLEIPAHIGKIRKLGLPQLDYGNNPFIIDDKYYFPDLGLVYSE
jgi:CRISPR-associated endonuclease/helicase Cas3